ncbi:hypothetical protein K1719_042533 [Acacia pycnantha]|nr:hypothetical protein K1719_042533 [Acacia pycnantha]
MNVRALANHYAAQLSICCSLSPINCTLARAIHAHMITSGFRPWGHILNRLIDIYCKSSKIGYARQLLMQFQSQILLQEPHSLPHILLWEI